MLTNELVFVTSPWASGNIRGNQIAKRLNAICDPKEPVSKDSIFVFIKSTPNMHVPRMYVDLIDAYGILTSLSKFPNAKIIVMNELAKNYVSNRVYNDIIVIPEHHCNFENIVREHREVKTVGFVGDTLNFSLDPIMVREELTKIGLDFIWCIDFKTRDDVCNFYKKIDIQLTFRPKSPTAICPAELKNPLKLANAGSFKIPSVCCAEPSYVAEFNGCFLIAENIEEIVRQCRKLKNDAALYNILSFNCHEKAKDYHIDNIIPMFEKLKDWELNEEPTNEMIHVVGFEIGGLKTFQVKNKAGELVAQTKLVIRNIDIGGVIYTIGGVRNFKVFEEHRRKGIGAMLFQDILSYAKKSNIDMLAGFSIDYGLQFFLSQGCKIIGGNFNGQAMFYLPVKDACKPEGAIDLMGTMW